MPTVVRSHAKINLGLFLGPPRPDGFHALVTVYQTLETHDLVTVKAKRASTTTIRITSNDPRVPTTENKLAERNTVWKMIELALDTLETTADVEVHIDKRLPVQGGLGAGSGNAVAALVGLDAELGTSIPQPVHPETRDSRQSRLRRAAVSRRRNGSRRRPRAGSLSAHRYRANMVRNCRAGNWRFHAAGLSRLGRTLRRGRFDRGGRYR